MNKRLLETHSVVVESDETCTMHVYLNSPTHKTSLTTLKKNLAASLSRSRKLKKGRGADGEKKNTSVKEENSAAPTAENRRWRD